MAVSNLVNENFKHAVQSQGGWTPNPNSFQFIKVPSPKTEVGSAKILIGPQAFIVPPASCTLAGFTLISGGGAIQPNTQKVIENNMPCLNMDAQGTCAGVFKSNTDPGTTSPCTCKVTIQDAGQDKVQGE